MTIHLATFASDDMSRSAELCVKSAIQKGGIDECCAHIETPATIFRGNGFHSKAWALHPETSRGYGFFVWKPQVILEAMRWCCTSDPNILIYSDAGVEFIEPVQTVIDRMDQDIYLFGNEHEHAHWCKRDIVCAVWNESTRNLASYRDGYWEAATDSLDFAEDGGVHWSMFATQAQASVIFLRVNDYTRKFVKEWLDWCLFEGGRLIDDSPSRTPNHPEFKENRHDQAILTTLAYREGIKLHEWYVRYEGYTPGHMACYPKEFERPLFFHHRRRNHEWEGVAA